MQFFKKLIIYKPIQLLLIIIIFVITRSANSTDLPDQLAPYYTIIPKPVSIIAADGAFMINPATRIVGNHAELRPLADFIANFLATPLNAKIKIAPLSIIPQLNTISLILDQHANIAPEGYQLTITSDNIIITAQTATGAFWAFMTLCQLMPVQAHQKMALVNSTIKVPCVIIKDAPRFAYRGLHLDSSRHFFPVEFIKKYLDLMAFYKLNFFHWHLTDDQGWRIEIKKYPKLQAISAHRDQTLSGHLYSSPPTFDNKSYGGYYTQVEIKEIVAYAQQRHITIIPEIELPGHSLAVLAAYPNLGCTGGPYQTGTTWGIFDDVYCAGNDEVFIFLQNILTEIFELFPGKYIHIGGDEVRKNRWQQCPKCQVRMKNENLKTEADLQDYFITRIEKFINSHHRQIIGWDEIISDQLSPTATIMSWRGTQGGIQAANSNYQVIMTPDEYLYFDYYQSKSPYEPLAIGGHTPIEKVYNYEPIPAELTDSQAKYILGAQANVWTEYMATPAHVEYMVFPRLGALAELTWTPVAQKDYINFLSRLKHNINYLRAMSVYYAELH